MRILPLRTLVFLSLVAILGSVLYYAAPVTPVGLIAVTALSLLGAGVIPLSIPATTLEVPYSQITRESVAVTVIGIIGLAAWWHAILGVEIIDAVRSPWGLVNPFALSGIGIALFCSLLLLLRHARLGALLLVATLFSAVSMAAVVYPLGFGFDPFLHRATINHIAEYGTITPKPLYYIGQYALELMASFMGQLPLAAIDRFLLPILGAGMLVVSAWYGIAARAGRHTALAGLLLFPFGLLISTTPQGIAYVFALSAIFLTFGSSRALPALLAVASLLTHPFAGIPAVMYVAAWMIYEKLRPSLRPGFLALATVAAIFAIPVVFALQAARSGLGLELHFGNLFDPSRWHDLAVTAFFANNFSTSFDALYLVVNNLLWIVVLLAIIGAVVTRKYPLPLLFAGAMLLNFLTLSLIFDFDFLISYERQDYAVRSLTLAHLFLLPHAMLLVAAIDERLQKKSLALQASFIALLAFVGTANVYGAYPRHDNYTRSSGFNVSSADVDAVYAIADKAADQDYIVLSNQSTAAAAVEAFGFAKYYHTDIFYYPIPTGGPLYQQYLAMVNDGPTRERAIKAMDIAGVDIAFFTVNDYWWQSAHIIENAKRVADDWFSVGDGKVTVFIFHR